MILNSFAVLDAFTTLIRIPLGVMVIGLALRVWRRQGVAAIRHDQWETQGYLAVLLSLLLLALNIVAWPLLYALLQSYVPQWPDVMCIYGVTRIGTGSSGLSGWLPGLLSILQITKPVTVFLSGAWCVLYLVNRKTTHGNLARRMLAFMTLFGFISVTDAALEGAYLVIPKRELLLDSGCCSAALRVDHVRQDEEFWNGSNARPLSLLFFGVNGALALALASELLGGRRPSTFRAATRLFLGTAISLPITGLFLVHVAAPQITGLPFHHCGYELLTRAPETTVGIAAFALGCFSLGWMAVLTGPSAEIDAMYQRLLFLSFFGYSGSVALFATELVLP